MRLFRGYSSVDPVFTESMNARIAAAPPAQRNRGYLLARPRSGDVDTRPDGADRVHLVMKCLEETGLFDRYTEARGQFSGIRRFKAYRKHHETGMEYLEGTGLAVFDADLDLVSMSKDLRRHSRRNRTSRTDCPLVVPPRSLSRMLSRPCSRS